MAAILITTKRGKYNTREVTFTYDHVTNFQARRPKFVDAATYAEAINEARGYEGLSARYAPEEVDAFRNGANRWRCFSYVPLSLSECQLDG